MPTKFESHFYPMHFYLPDLASQKLAVPSASLTLQASLLARFDAPYAGLDSEVAVKVALKKDIQLSQYGRHSNQQNGNVCLMHYG